MTDGRNLNILQSGRQMLRAFGGMNETYGCSEAELSSSLNFSGRGYPALQTRATRKKVREVQDVNGMYHLNGLVICRGTTLEYTPDADESRAGAVVLENALTDNEKAMTGMGTKVLIWPDKKAFDTVSGELTDLAAAWTLGGGTMTVTPCDGEGRTYTPDGVMAWSGSLPAKVSGALDTGKLTAVERAVGGQLDARYYLYLHRKTDTGSGRLLVYDTERGLWQEESAAGTGMVSTGQQLYLWDGNALWAADPEREVSGEDETGLKFEAVTGDIGLAVPDDKYISRVTLRMDALAHTVLTVAVSYDGGDWETVSSCAVTRDHQRVNLPFVPRRHDTMRLRFAGTGQMVLRSMAFTFADAAGARVSGAVPRR